jgi:hypothetical protein
VGIKAVFVPPTRFVADAVNLLMVRPAQRHDMFDIDRARWMNASRSFVSVTESYPAMTIILYSRFEFVKRSQFCREN